MGCCNSLCHFLPSSHQSSISLSLNNQNLYALETRVPPPPTSDLEISAELPGKKGEGVKIEKKRRKIVKGKVEKLQKKSGIMTLPPQKKFSGTPLPSLAATLKSSYNSAIIRL